MLRPSASASLADWLAWQARIHPAEIDLGLERVATVYCRLAVGRPAPVVVTVAGTNGKGSSIAMLEAILLAEGIAVGSYTSPHLLRYNERVRLRGQEVADAAFCRAFASVEAARGSTSLTYFEFGTLAALCLLAEAGVDVALLEVGLGGRLDAVNIVDADIALITALGRDHRAWLGDDPALIAAEKAAIMRRHAAAVCSDRRPPPTVQATASELATRLYRLGDDFDLREYDGSWCWRSRTQRLDDLPWPALPGRHQLDNAAGVIKVRELLGQRHDLPALSHQAIVRGLRTVSLAGRFECADDAGVSIVFDVAHNRESVQVLADALRRQSCGGRTYIVIGLLQDKDSEGIFSVLASLVDRWFCATLPPPRGRTAEELSRCLPPGGQRATFPDGPVAAYRAARAGASAGDRIVVCGSFLTVAAVQADAAGWT